MSLALSTECISGIKKADFDKRLMFSLTFAGHIHDLNTTSFLQPESASRFSTSLYVLAAALSIDAINEISRQTIEQRLIRRLRRAACHSRDFSTISRSMLGSLMHPSQFLTLALLKESMSGIIRLEFVKWLVSSRHVRNSTLETSTPLALGIPRPLIHSSYSLTLTLSIRCISGISRPETD